MFSRRLPPHAQLNALSVAVERAHAQGTAVVDLTESNPTRVGLPYPEDLLEGLSTPEALQYAPYPLGKWSAREAIALDQARRGASVDPAQVVLTASTSEAYSWLFKLLCNPGDVVLVPRPSYPLFEHLTRLEGVVPVPFDLEYHGRWSVDFATMEMAPSNTRAIVLVSPNNPTGSYVSADEFDRVKAICRARGAALIVDEVFADYPLEVDAPTTDVAAQSDVLTFTLGGLSKSVGLPQLKLGWIVVGGPAASRTAAMGCLEIIADTYLSVATPVQLAVPGLLRLGADVRRAIHDRVRTNLGVLRQTVRGFAECEVLTVEGGWSAVIRIPATRPEEVFVLSLLEEKGLLVYPGYFFDFQREAFVVVSLLPPLDMFQTATMGIMERAVQ